MTTPLMLLLSSITPSLGYDHPVDTMYMNRNDRALLMREAIRLGKMAMDDTQILLDKDAFDDEVCDTSQIINSEVIDVSPATAIILTRLRECYKVFCRVSQMNEEEEKSVHDLDTDSVILHLEGNPRYIYTYVYNTMENRGLDYDTRVLRLAELYNTLVGVTSDTAFDAKQSFLVNRFQMMGELSFWQRLVYHDYMHQRLAAPKPLTLNDLERVKQELKGMGFYGFVNPWVMYSEFANSRVNRKVELNISSDVIEFLRKVVLSGGVSVQ